MARQGSVRYGFERQMSIGEQGVRFLLDRFPGVLEATSGRHGDLRIRKTNDLIEVKTDSHLFSETPNFFFERFSNLDRQTPGGPWQAKANGCKYYAYLFLEESKLYVFNVDSLLAYLESIIPVRSPVNVLQKGSGWTTQGYGINRNQFKDLYKEVNL
jgi:hypothetical protein